MLPLVLAAIPFRSIGPDGRLLASSDSLLRLPELPKLPRASEMHQLKRLSAAVERRT